MASAKPSVLFGTNKVGVLGTMQSSSSLNGPGGGWPCEVNWQILLSAHHRVCRSVVGHRIAKQSSDDSQTVKKHITKMAG